MRSNSHRTHSFRIFVEHPWLPFSWVTCQPGALSRNDNDCTRKLYVIGRGARQAGRHSEASIGLKTLLDATISAGLAASCPSSVAERHAVDGNSPRASRRRHRRETTRLAGFAAKTQRGLWPPCAAWSLTRLGKALRPYRRRYRRALPTPPRGWSRASRSWHSTRAAGTAANRWAGWPLHLPVGWQVSRLVPT